MPNHVVWFDIPATDLDRAVRFYSAVFGAEVKKQTHGAHAMGILPHGNDDVSGCIFSGPDAKPSADGPLLYLNCKGRIDAAIAAVEPNGGKILTPKTQIGSYGFRAVVLDSEGNRVALHST